MAEPHTVGAGRETTNDLPVAGVLAELLGVLERGHGVLVAEPGAGKTTLVPPALLDAPWLEGRIIVLEPRRVVARAAARRMAEVLGEEVGGLVGTRMRMETRVGARTRIEVVTEGVFARAVLDDPELRGVGAVVFDEYHERSLDADLGLALALDVARSLRPDLRLLAMSATIDAEAVVRLMDGAGIVRSPGRVHPIELRHRPVGARERTEDAVVAAVRGALSEGGAKGGSVLAFLPGRAEVDRVVATLRGTSGADVLPLHGGLDAKAQDLAVAAPPPGTRKVVVATPIAESSLTIAGVDWVVDSGLVREPVHDYASGVTRLETRRASLASVDQRAGRAGRTGPGTAIRLWPEGATRALAPASPPEIVRADLSGLLLDCLDWGVEPAEMSWLDAPPAAGLSAARQLLLDLGAIVVGEGEAAGITAIGRAIRSLPLDPRTALALLLASPDSRLEVARLAVLRTEQGLGGDAVDLSARLRSWMAGRAGTRGKAADRMARRWAEAASGALETVGNVFAGDAVEGSATAPFVRAYRDRVGRARGPARPDGRRAYLLASGRGAFLEASDPLASSDWIVALELTGQAREQRVTAALPTSRGEVEDALGHAITEETAMRVEADDRMKPVRRRSLGAIVLEETRVDKASVPAGAVEAALADALAKRGIDRLPWSAEARRLRERIAWLRAIAAERTREGEAVGESEALEWPDVSDEALAASIHEWLAPQLAGLDRVSAVGERQVAEGLAAYLPWNARAELDRIAPASFNAPTGTRVPIEYPADGGAPRIAVRVQELFGLTEHPRAAGRPLLLDLLSPARRPIQTTADLPGFWQGSWADVRREMRARYPRHPWPEKPDEAAPTTRVKPRGT